jgi:3-(3-hydroxy-phenyl)propionate hydroxylase
MTSIEGVLIAGGGVVGLTTALSLAQRGVPVTVFEAEPELVKEYRASTFHPPTLEMLNDLGVAERLIAKGLVADRVQYRDRTEGMIAEFDLGLLKNDTPYPFRLQIEQYALALLLLERLQRMPNTEVLFTHRVTDASLVGDHVLVTAETAAGPQEYQAPYLVGADGGRSAVRHALGIGFEGLTYPERYLVTFTAFDFTAHMPDLTYVNYVSDPTEWFVLLRSPDLWRVLFPMRPEDAEAADEALDEMVQARYQRVVATGVPYPILYRAIYAVHQRIAATYRKGRALLAGDAAHLNNPLGGMGLNGGIHDAVNLGEKLAKVWHGEAGDEALDSYTAERRRTATEHVLAHTHQNHSSISETDPEARKRQQNEMKKTAADPEAAYRFLLRISMIESIRAMSGA